jgi:hypothetical protein
MRKLFTLWIALAAIVAVTASSFAGWLPLAGGGGGGGFSPSSLSPTLWLEASQATIFSDNGVTTISNGGAIQQWNDKSTNARVMNNTTANKPAY